MKIMKGERGVGLVILSFARVSAQGALLRETPRQIN